MKYYRFEIKLNFFIFCRGVYKQLKNVRTKLKTEWEKE